MQQFDWLDHQSNQQVVLRCFTTQDLEADGVQYAVGYTAGPSIYMLLLWCVRNWVMRGQKWWYLAVKCLGKEQDAYGSTTSSVWEESHPLLCVLTVAGEIHTVPMIKTYQLFAKLTRLTELVGSRLFRNIFFMVNLIVN